LPSPLERGPTQPTGVLGPVRTLELVPPLTGQATAGDLAEKGLSPDGADGGTGGTRRTGISRTAMWVWVVAAVCVLAVLALVFVLYGHGRHQPGPAPRPTHSSSPQPSPTTRAGPTPTSSASPSPSPSPTPTASSSSPPSSSPPATPSRPHRATTKPHSHRGASGRPAQRGPAAIGVSSITGRPDPRSADTATSAAPGLDGVSMPCPRTSGQRNSWMRFWT
jgi:hypothetical protein